MLSRTSLLHVRQSGVSNALRRRNPSEHRGPESVLKVRDIMTSIESDERVKVVVLDSAVAGSLRNHSDFDLTRLAGDGPPATSSL